MIGNTIVFAVAGVAPWGSEAELVYQWARKYPEGLAKIVERTVSPASSSSSKTIRSLRFARK